MYRSGCSCNRYSEFRLHFGDMDNTDLLEFQCDLLILLLCVYMFHPFSNRRYYPFMVLAIDRSDIIISRHPNFVSGRISSEEDEIITFTGYKTLNARLALTRPVAFGARYVPRYTAAELACDFRA